MMKVVTRQRQKEGHDMKSTILPKVVAMLGFVILGCSVQRAVAGDHCFYKGSMFSDGAAACQTGSQYRCDDGDWKALGTTCKDAPAPSKTCEYGGVSYSTGSASCQGGMQHRCEDGRWARLADSCPVGDAPIKTVPSGRTCMFDGATVSNNSTICRTGSTFLCSDGEWVNLGTACR
jgi:hypothetical protein